MADQNFNVWNSFTQGMGLADHFARMQDEERQRRMMAGQDQAMQQLSDQPYIPGYEGVKGAEMVPWLADTFRSNPELAMKLGHEIAAPYAMQRDIEKAKGIEQGKSDIHMNAVMDAMNRFRMPRGGNPGANIFQAGYNPQQAQFPGGALSPLAPADTQDPGSLDDLSGTSMRVKYDKNGPEFSFDQESDLGMATKKGHLKVEQGNLKVNEGKLKLDQEEQPDKRAKTTADMVRAQVQNEQDAITAVNSIVAEMAKVRAQDMDPIEKEATLRALRPLYDQAQQRMLDITKGLGKLSTNVEDYGNERKPTADPRLKPSLEGKGSAVPQSAVSAMTPKTPAIAQPGNPKPGSDIGAGLDWKRSQELKKQLTGDEVSAAMKDIAAARHDTAKMGNYKEAMGQLHDLVSQNELGHPVTVGVGGEVAKSLHKMNPLNAQLDNLSSQVGNSLIKEGGSQLMNTIIERMMITAPVPSLGTDPHQNRINSVNQMNGLHGAEQLPDAMQRWADTHGGTLRGFEGAWMDYFDNNKPYSYEKNAQGKVTVKPKREDMLPAEDWFTLREHGYPSSTILQIRSQGKKMKVVKSGPHAGTLLTQEKGGEWLGH